MTILFDDFYDLYPRKVGGKPVIRATYEAITNGGKWVHNRQTGEKWFVQGTHEEIMEGLRRFVKAQPWDDIKFCAHPTTWLNQGRWEDEHEISNPFGERLTATQALERNGTKLRIVE